MLALLSEVECFEGRYKAAVRHAEDAYRIAVQCEHERNRSGALLRITLANAYLGNVDAARAAGAQAEELMLRNEDFHSRGASAMVLIFLSSRSGTHKPYSTMRFRLRNLSSSATSRSQDRSSASWRSHRGTRRGRRPRTGVVFSQGVGRACDRSRRSWALAEGARSRALYEAARGRFEEALVAAEAGLREYERLPEPFQRARTLLVRGTIQRRAKQRRAARESLSQALAIFEELGARLWAEKLARSLRASGAAPPATRPTPTEAQVAARAAAGETNREIADALFMSVKTVEANLSRVYRKLDVSSRRQLGGKLERQT